MTSRKSSGSSRPDSAVESTRSQNITVSWRRSPSGTSWLTKDFSDLATVESISVVPQSPQNCELTGLSEAHFGQRKLSAAPQAAQNRLPAGLSEPQLEQRTARLPTKLLNPVSDPDRSADSTSM